MDTTLVKLGMAIEKNVVVPDHRKLIYCEEHKTNVNPEHLTLCGNSGISKVDIIFI
jgi:hypothetical protein